MMLLVDFRDKKKSAEKDFNNILIIKPSSIGDVIHALPFLKAIREDTLMLLFHG